MNMLCKTKRYSSTLARMSSRMGSLIVWQHSPSVTGLWNWATYAWARASFACMRLLEFNWRHICTKSIALTLAPGILSVRARLRLIVIKHLCIESIALTVVPGIIRIGDRFRFLGSDSSMATVEGELISLISAGEGYPVTSRIRFNWSKVELPANSGFVESISARTVPTLHKSTPFPYDVDPKRISGARYHRLVT